MNTAAAVLLHATCIRLDAAAMFGAKKSAGVLLLGASGAGKSDLALRLMAMGATLVADDYCELFVRGDALYARPPAAIAGLIEARGIGIVEVPHAASARIVLAVELGRSERLPLPRRLKLLKLPAAHRNAAPPVVKIPPFEASAPAKIVLAVAAYAHALHRDAAPPYKVRAKKRKPS